MEQMVEILKSLGDETRYTMIQLLLSHDYCVGALARKLNISESAVSQHLKILRNAGITTGEKRGYFTHYSVDRDLLAKTASNLSALAELEQTNTICSHRGQRHHSSCNDASP